MQYIKPIVYFLMLSLIVYALKELHTLIGISAVNEYKLEQQALVNKQVTEALKRERIQREKIESARAIYNENLQQKQIELNDLANKLAIGSKRLRISATCKPMPRASDNASRTESASAELNSDARQAYTNLRRGIIEVESKLNFCISTVKSMTL